jgi:hypothetical protein
VSEPQPPAVPDVADETPRYGPAFWTCLAIGGACVAFGVLSLITRRGAADPVTVGAFVVALALLHDLLLAPVVVAVAWVVRAITPGAVRGVVLGALALSAIVVGFAVPLLAGWGEQPDNPSLLPRRYGIGTAIVVACVWFSAAAIVLARRHRR